jgi:hypothetical protein
MTSPIPKLPCPPGESPFHIKGNFYRGFVLGAAAAVGFDSLCGVLADEALVSFVKQPFLAAGRYDVFPFVPLTFAIASLRGARIEELVRASTAAQARYDAAHAYKMIFASHGPEEIAVRVARFNSQIYDFGEFASSAVGPGRIVLDFDFIPAFLEPWFRPMHVAYAQEALRIVGAKHATIVSQVATDAGARGQFPLRSFHTELQWR